MLLGMLFLLILLIIYRTLQTHTDIVLDADYNELISNHILDNNHIKKLEEYSSDVTVGYLNADGTKSLYIFSSPIQYMNSSGQYSIIDTRIAYIRNEELKRNNYKYTIANSDIKTYFPENLNNDRGIIISSDTQYEFGFFNDSKCVYLESANNFINHSRSMLLYKNMAEGYDLYTYPTAAGVNLELKCNKVLKNNYIAAWVKVAEGITIEKEPGGYLIFKNSESAITGVVQLPIIKDGCENISVDTNIEIEKKNENLYYIFFFLDNTCVFENSIVLLSFESKRENQPDNALYSYHPDMEYAYLNNFAVIGKSPDRGIGRLMIRFKFAKTFSLQANSILDAKFNVYSLTQNVDDLELVSILEDWCSITGNWNKNYKTGEKVAESYVNNAYLCFNITSEVKKWCNDSTGRLEYYGLLMKSKNEIDAFNIILSNDNLLYNNYTIVTFRTDS